MKKKLTLEERIKEVERCLDEILEHSIIKHAFPEIDLYRGLIEDKAKNIADCYLRKEQHSRITASTLAGASVYLAFRRLYEDGKIPKKIAQADAADAAGRNETNVRLAIKRILRSVGYPP